jgi:hypothetical protein
MKLYLSTIVLSILFFSATAQKYSNEFLNIGIGARAQAMGGAHIANVQDVTAGYWNPAALTQLDLKRGFQLGLMHTEWYAGVGKYDYLGAAIPTRSGRGAIGISAIRFGVDDIPNTLSLFNSDGSVNFDNIKNFSASDFAVLFSIAQKMRIKGGERLSIGGNVKIVRRKIGSFAQSWGFGIDAAALYKLNHLTFGVNVRDISNTFNAWRFSFTDKEKEVLAITDNTIPISSLELTKPQVALGMAYNNTTGKITYKSELSLVATTDGKRNTLISANPVSISPAAGLEVGYDKLVYARAGISNFQQNKDFGQAKFWTAQPAFGVGLNIRGINLDYAYTSIGGQGGKSYSHIVSLLLNIKPKS